MTVRVLFLGEGPSDSGIVPQVENLAVRIGVDIAVTDPDLGRLEKPPGRAVVDKLKEAAKLGGPFDLILVHRDADRDGRDARLAEIASAVDAVAPDVCYAAVIPVRMTEAWLLTDEHELRQVSGNPKGTMQLNLPGAKNIESIADPKRLLKEVLGLASGLSGRRLARFHERFSQHRRQLLERLDPNGSIRLVSSWNYFVDDVEAGLLSATGRSS